VSENLLLSLISIAVTVLLVVVGWMVRCFMKLGADVAALLVEMADARAEIQRTRQNVRDLRNTVSPVVMDYEIRQRNAR
jgi:hypothetical protein